MAILPILCVCEKPELTHLIRNPYNSDWSLNNFIILVYANSLSYIVKVESVFPVKTTIKLFSHPIPKVTLLVFRVRCGTLNILKSVKTF